MGLVHDVSALASIMFGGPRYDEAQRDYRDALHAQLSLAR